MDAQTFDRLTASVAHQRSRRGALRLLAGGVLAGLVSPRLTRAMQADRDGDGLYDDDETGVYGTNPDVYDTDGDGSGDGEEVYYGTDPLVNPVAGGEGLAGETYAEVACDPSLVQCGRQCVNLAFDLLHCGACNNLCPSVDGFVGVCSFGVCSLTTPPNRGVPSRDAGIGDCEDVPFPYGCDCVINGECAY
jgi:hypothetical protein